MVFVTETCRYDDEGAAAISRARIDRATAPAAGPSEAANQQVTIYYLAWRPKPSHPWRSEEFFNRHDAHCEYFARLQRGMEVYLEVHRRPAG